MNNGWILLHRKLLENPLAKKPLYFALWVQLLLLASHKGKSFIFLGNRHNTNSGQFITGRKALSEMSGIKETTIERILDYFEKSGQIGQQKTTKYRLITICNWNKYQKRTTNGQQTDTINNDNNINNNTPDKVGTLEEVTQTITMKKSAFRYREDQPSDSFEDVVDMDTGVIEKEAPKLNINKKMFELIKWAEEKRGGKFINKGKQMKAISKMKEAKISPNSIMNRWVDLSEQNYYKENGLDFMSVANSFDKKPL